MAKGKGKPAYGGRRANLDDDAYSDASSATNLTRGGAEQDLGDEDEDRITDVYQDNVELLFEKRGATRAKAYSELIAYMKSDLREDEAEKNSMTLIRCCLEGIRKGSGSERELAATALGLHFLSLPGPSEALFQEVQGVLDAAALEGAGQARCSAIEAMAVCCFVAAEDDYLTREVMERMEHFWGRGEAVARAAALRGWSLLFTTLSGLLSGPEVEALLQQMASLIGDKAVEVRSAAGEVVALLCSSYRWFLQSVEEEDEDAEEGFDEASQSSADVPENLDNLVHRMKDLATHNRHDALRTSKRDKAALRTTFRGILEAVETGAVKAEKIKLKHGDVLCVDTLPGKVALSAFKRLLAGGLQAHLQSNPLLHDVFSFAPSGEAPARLSYLEKRHYRSPSSAASKEKANSRKQDRGYKMSRHAPSDGDCY